MIDLGVVTPNKASIFLVKFYGKVRQEMGLKKFTGLTKKFAKSGYAPFVQSLMAETRPG